MNYLSVQTTYMKQHNTNTFFFPDTSIKKMSIMDKHQTQLNENNNQINTGCDQTKTLQEVWSQHNFNLKTKSVPTLLAKPSKITWAEQQLTDKVEVSTQISPPKIEEPKVETEVNEQKSIKEDSPSHHARRPPNAFLIFCKKHRPIVRERFPNLENRGVTKILGEWWALLNNSQKQPYNDLAKEYKDAFLTANPNFRWYKLPAPPLRTLTTRPLTITKNSIPLSSPTSPLSSEFNLGKLADESQLGGLTSLMNNSYKSLPKSEDEKTFEEQKNIEKLDRSLTGSEMNNSRLIVPPKPLKKRFVELYEDDTKDTSNDGQNDSGNLTKQDLMNKVVDGMFAKHHYDQHDNGFKETRKSERICKGKRYEIFMTEGKLLGNKRETKIQKQHSRVYNKFDMEQNGNIVNNNNNNNNDIIIRKPETPKLDLSDTIKRLAERTNVKIDFDSHVNLDFKEQPDQNECKRVRSISETSDSSLKDGGGGQKNSPPNFNLNLRISNLPCLSYDEFLQRKRESKKRKIRAKTEGDVKQKSEKLDVSESHLVGSKKRKNKHSITHLGKKDVSLSNDLLGLATLAEVAANTQKINEEISMN